MRVVSLGIVVKEDKVLLVHRRFPPVIWGAPGGYIEENETFEDATEREVYEETGISCTALDCILEFNAYNSQIKVYVCKYLSGKLRCSYESKDLRWFTIEELPEEISPGKEIFIKAINLIK